MSFRKITVKSGNEEFTLEVTEEEYQKYYRPWWSQRKREQRNREAMERNGYTEESYEAWRDNASEEVGIPDMELQGVDELVEKKLLLGVLADAMDSLLPEERELAMKVFGEQIPVTELSQQMGGSRRTLAFRKDKVLEKLRHFFREHGFVHVFLKDIYQESALQGRFDYIPADSSAGVVVYDDVFAYSHHATDPACGKLLNAFDLVRIHKFGGLDEKVPEDTEAAKLPSFKAMCDFAVNDENVKMTIAGERMEIAEKEFSGENEDWLKQLEYEKRSTVVKNTLKNLLLILNNDEKLKGIVFNQLSDGMEIKGEVPWEHPSRFWRDADDAQLISYVDLTYGTFSARNYDIAVTKVADDRSYHPIREFLASLPEWDKVPRVDTILVDFLGASDNAYVRAVTRKTLCGAIARVMNPGCKFDTMLVLNGPQGKGKSTLISKLCGEWFNDSLLLNDTKDKTAAEKLQGYWILEIGELAGLKKTEIETLRGFLSRQNDIYRASFGRRATPHPRQYWTGSLTVTDTGRRRMNGG